jgi:hypothetical protein
MGQTEQVIATRQDAERLPPGTVIGIPLMWMTTAEKRADVFRGGRHGWFINGADCPVSDGQLFSYGRGWIVKSLPADCQ